MKLDRNPNYVLTLDDGTELEVSPDDAYFIWHELDKEFHILDYTAPVYVNPCPCTPTFPSPNYWYSSPGDNT